MNNLSPRVATLLRRKVTVLLLAATSLVSIFATSASAKTKHPVIASFTASPTTIIAGDSTQLYWVVAGALSIAIDHGVGEVRGSTITVTPKETTTYALTATNERGTKTAKVKIIVKAATPPPSVSLAAPYLRSDRPGAAEG